MRIWNHTTWISKFANSGSNNAVVEEDIVSLESYVYSCHEVKSAVAMQSILYMDTGKKPLKKMPNIRLFSEASCIWREKALVNDQSLRPRWMTNEVCMISGFCHKVDENCIMTQHSTVLDDWGRYIITNKVHYTHHIHRTCFSHSCDHLQGGSSFIMHNQVVKICRSHMVCIINFHTLLYICWFWYHIYLLYTQLWIIWNWRLRYFCAQSKISIR